MQYTLVTHSAAPFVSPFFFFLPHFDVICELLLNKRTATWYLLVKCIINKAGYEQGLSLFQAVCGAVSAVADCLSLFALFRVGAGAAAAGCLLSRFVYCMELSVTSNRTAAGFVSNIFMTVGYAILSLLAYFIRDWRHLMLAVSVPGVLLLFFWW